MAAAAVFFVLLDIFTIYIWGLVKCISQKQKKSCQNCLCCVIYYGTILLLSPTKIRENGIVGTL